jgi:signal transduction histidine kinase
MLILTLIYHSIPDIIGIPAPKGLWIDHIETLRTLPLITGALFIATFFRLKQNLPFWNRFILGLTLLSSFVFVTSLLSASTIIPFVIDILNLLTLAVSITIGVIMLRADYKPARYFLLSWVIFGLGVLVWSLSNLGLIPAYFVIRQAPQLAGIFEITFMSLALAQRLRHIERVEFELEQEVKENERTRRFIHIIFHDLANPLSVALGLIELLKKKCSEYSEKNRTYFDHITNALDAMKETVDSVRTLESLRFGNRSLKLETVDVIDAIYKALDIYEDKLQKKSLTICKEGFDSKTMAIKANLGLFKNEIIGNLLSNAIKFSHRGGTIRFAIEQLKNEIMIIVADEGVGIPGDGLSSIFKASHKNSLPGTEGESGSGYGMPIVKESIAYCGGRIEVESHDSSSKHKKRGTTFKLYFQRSNS